MSPRSLDMDKLKNKLKHEAKDAHIIAIIGAGEHAQEVMLAAQSYTLSGCAVWLPHLFDKKARSEILKEVMKKVSKIERLKIRMSHQVVVVAPDGEVTPHVRKMINYAKNLRKAITYIPSGDHGRTPLIPLHDIPGTEKEDDVA